MLTSPAIKRLEARPQAYQVPASKGLALLIHPSGTKVWRWKARVNGQLRGTTLGRWPKVTFPDASRRADELRLMVEEGLDPIEMARKARVDAVVDANTTVKDFAERWMVEVVNKVRKDPARIKATLKRQIYPHLGWMRIKQVTGKDVQRVIFGKRDEGRGKPAAALALRHLLKRMFAYARIVGVIESNPTDLTPRRSVAQPRSRTRSLSEAELKKFLQRLRDQALGLKMGIALKLLLLTMCRKGELLQARWEHIDLELAVWELPEELSKTGKKHIFYLSRQAVSCFEQLKALAGRAEIVLPRRESLTQGLDPSALNKAIARHRWGMKPFAPHDLRRTASTQLNEKGYHPDHIEVALNHAPHGVRGVYNRALYAQQRRQMLQEWADWLDSVEE